LRSKIGIEVALSNPTNGRIVATENTLNIGEEKFDPEAPLSDATDGSIVGA